MTRLRSIFFAAAWVAAITAGIAACGGGGGISGSGAKPGTLRLALTDAPACGYAAVNVTVQKVRVHQNANAADSDSGWSEVVLAAPQRVDLLSLANGVLMELGQTALPAGRYTQLRLVLADNGSGPPYANSVVPEGGSETALATPSGQTSGLKADIAIDVPSGQVADFVLDFDACKSVVRRGNSGQYNLKPVLTLIPRLSDVGQRITGFVDPTLAGATVSAQSAGVVLKAAVPASGAFTLYPLAPGNVDLVVTATGRATTVLTGVAVTAAAATEVGSAALPLVPPLAASAPVNVFGSVTPTSATVRALQTLSGGPVIEAGWAPVNADTGVWVFGLPAVAPVRAAWSAAATGYSFAADTAAGTHYTIEAASAGVTKTQPVDTSGPVSPIAFGF